MSERFWIFLRTYCLESSLIGLKYFYIYPDILSRFFWSLNLIWVVSTSCATAWMLYSRFREMPTRITIENQFESVYHLPYPAITLCSPNQMTISSLNYFSRSLIDGNMTIDLEKTLPLLLGFYELLEDVDEEDLRQLQDSLELNRYTISEVMGKMPLSCDRFLKRCLIGGKIRDCSELFRPIITAHGYCCAFNSKYFFNGKGIEIYQTKLNHTVKAVGMRSTLSVVTDYEPDDAIDNTLLNAGSVRVMLTDWTEFPVDYETHLVDTNGEAYFFVRAIYTYCSDEVKTLPPDSRDCYFDNERLLAVFRHYRNSDCDHMCYVLAVLKSCKCWLFFIPFLRFERTCKATQIPCIMAVKKNIGAWLDSEDCLCPRDCESRQYYADLSVGNFQAVPYMIDSQNPVIGMKLNSSTSILNFLFTSSVYVKQKQETVMSIISVVSNLGGVFGVFMGCSGISILEIGFYVYRGIRSYMRSRGRRQREVAIDQN